MLKEDRSSYEISNTSERDWVHSFFILYFFCTQFLRLCVHYSKFIKDVKKITKPLTQLLAKETEFHWSESQQKIFKVLKNALCTASVLRSHP